MTELITLLEQYSITTILIIFILFVLVIIGVYQTVEKIKGVFNSYHTKKTDEEKKDNTIDTRLEQLEKAEAEDKKQFEEVKTDIQNIRELINKMQTTQNRSNRATCRSAMYRLSSELISKGWMTQIEYDTLSDLSDVYLMSGSVNDSYVRPSLVQRALTLPVLTDEEVENIRNKEREENK